MFENDRFDYGYNEEVSVHGLGTYHSVPYNPTIRTMCAFDGIELKEIKATNSSKYEIYWDGEKLNTYSTEKVAKSFFMDFTGLSKAKFEKLMKAVA